jgi:hypothetical protein
VRLAARLAALLLMSAAAAAASACSGGSSSSQPAGPCGNPYQPSAAGTRWQYRTTSATGTFTATDTVTSASSTGFAVTSRTRGGSAVLHYRCSPAGIAALDAAGVAGMVAGSQIHHAFTTTSMSGVTLPPSPAGKTWRQTFRVHGSGDVDGASEMLTGTVSTTFTAASARTGLTVPAGSFHVLSVSEVTVFRLVVTVRGVTVPVRTVVRTTADLAPGVGLVRSVTTGNLLGAQLGSQTVLLSSHPH